MRLRLTLAFGIIAAITATALIYWPGVHGGFLLDDYSNIVQNQALQIHTLTFPHLMAAAFSSQAGPLDRPISMLSFALNEYFSGPGPYAMKVTNIFIHAFNGLLLYTVAALTLTAYRRRFRPELSRGLTLWTAVAITAAWLLLPINLTAVLYVVQRMTSLSGTFVLAGMALYLWGRTRMLDGRSGLWMLWAAMIVCGGLGVLAKEIGALLPVYALAVEWTLFSFARPDGRPDRRLQILYLVVLILPGIAGVAWLWPSIQASLSHSDRPFTLGQRLLTEPRVVLLYIAWSLAPSLGTLSLYHDDFPYSTGLLHPPTTLLAILGVTALVVVAIRQRTKRPLISLGILWFLGGQLLTATFFNLELVFEHRNYLPDFGLLLALFGTLLLHAPENRLVLARRGLVVGLIVLYAAILGLRVHQWANPIRFAAISAAEHPNSPRATYNLGKTYANLVTGPDSRMYPRAVRALEHAAELPSASILPDSALLMLSAKTHKPPTAQWWKHTAAKLSSRPITPQDINALTAMVHCAADGCHFSNQHMTEVFKAALNRNPANPALIDLYGVYTFRVLHDYALTQKVLRTTVAVAPSQPTYRINLIKVQIFLRKFKAARKGIAGLEKLNRYGRLDDALSALRKSLAKAERTPLATHSSVAAGLRSNDPSPP